MKNPWPSPWGPVIGCPMNANMNIHHGIPHGRFPFMACAMVHVLWSNPCSLHGLTRGMARGCPWRVPWKHVFSWLDTRMMRPRHGRPTWHKSWSGPWCIIDYAMDRVHPMEWCMVQSTGPWLVPCNIPWPNISLWVGPGGMSWSTVVGHGRDHSLSN